MSSLSGPPSLPLTGGTISGALTVNGLATFAQAISAKNAAKAWVNFNGSGVVAINASHNVSSITDNGTGDYTINFTAALPNANYAMASGMNTSGGNAGGWSAALYNGGQTASACRLVYGNANTNYDVTVDTAVFFGG